MTRPLLGSVLFLLYPFDLRTAGIHFDFELLPCVAVYDVQLVEPGAVLSFDLCLGHHARQFVVDGRKYFGKRPNFAPRWMDWCKS